MTDRPIIFSAPMVRALLDGRKTQTRRILSADLQGIPYLNPSYGDRMFSRYEGGKLVEHSHTPGRPHPELVLPYVRFAAGDRLWVRENHQFRGASYNDGTEEEPRWSEDEWFRVRGSGGAGDSWDPDFPVGWWPSRHMGVHELTGPEHDEGPDVRGIATRLLPSIHMPRWASRLTLAVTDVRVERLNAMSAADAIAEGIQDLCTPEHSDFGIPGLVNAQHPVRAFWLLWEHINGAGSWEANPWVAAISFEVHRANIDALRSEPLDVAGAA